MDADRSITLARRRLEEVARAAGDHDQALLAPVLEQLFEQRGR
jgi:hypothetical protein